MQLVRTAAFVSLVSLISPIVAGCTSVGLTPPNVLVSPYDSSQGEALWAVAPLANESGTSIFELDEISDAVVRSCQQIEGIRCLPLNRVIAEMRVLGLTSVGSPEQAREIAGRLGVNGLLVGTVTDFDPYDPPKIGLSLVLETNGTFARPDGFSLDGLREGGRSTESGVTARYSETPVSSVSVVFDGRNHATKMEIRRYASGRHEPGSATGWETYLKSMPLFTEFAAHAAVGRLLDEERLRQARVRAGQQVSSR